MYLGDSTKLKDALVFVNTPPASEATQQNVWPFTVVISAADTGNHYIDLYSQYSRSRPYQQPQSKWGHLLPQWRFTDLDGNYVDKIKTTDTQITDVSGNIIGVTGSVQFYYIDDMPSFDYTSPVMLWATMEVSGRSVSYDKQGKELPGYANSKIIKGEPYYINGQIPTHLTITRNGISNIDKLKWIDNPFRYTILIKSNWLNTKCGASNGEIIVFDYPQNGAETYASVNEIYRDVLGAPVSAETWSPLSAYFQREDSNRFHVGGFQIGSVESSNITLNTQISAIVDVKVFPPFRDTGYVWISNGENRTINRVNLPYSFGNYYNPLLPGITTLSYNSSGFGSMYSSVSTVSGTPYWKGGKLSVDVFGGIYGIAVGGYCGNMWGVDPELDMMFNFGTDGKILCSVNIEPSGCSPQAIAIDSNLDMWVTLYGATSAVKYDKYGVATGDVAVPPYQITDVFTLTGNPDTILVRPVQVDTDTEDNIWVTYEHAISSLLLKYDSTGNYLVSCGLPVSAQPFGLVVDPTDNSVWVSNGYEILVAPYTWQYAASAGSIQHYSSAGVLLNTFDDIARPAYLTLDADKNLWFTFGYAGVGVISGLDVIKYFAYNKSFVPYTTAHIVLDNSYVGLNERLEGIACDGRNRIWILNSNENTVYVVNPQDTSDVVFIDIRPYDISKTQSIQGLGDWTGFQWLQKYYYTLPTDAMYYTISGLSNYFDINEFGSNFEIRKFNESWDSAQQMRDYALSDHINDKEILFDRYFEAMIGGLSAGEESIGRKSYERIANFVQNHVDIDTCEIDQLYALANELDVPIDNYSLTYPVSLKRLMNIISVSHTRLWGTRCKCNRNFYSRGGVCSTCGHSHCLNRSTNNLNTNTELVTGGDKIVIRTVHGVENYDLLELPSTVLSGVTSVNVYPISAASSISWLTSSDYNKYYFYRYIPAFCDVQVEGVINWDDSYTTLSENNSSLSSWYDKNQLIDTILNYDLHQGLQFNLE